MRYKSVFTDPQDIQSIREAGKISATILKQLRDAVKIGMSAKDIDDFAAQLCAENNVEPSFKGVEGVKNKYAYSMCLCVNDEVLHAIPSASKIFKEGDVIKLDFGIIYKGFFTDHCVTIALGEVDKRAQQLIATAKLCVDTAVKEAVVGNTVGDISYALQSVAELAGFDFVTSYCGHGIGKSLHEEPEVLAYGRRGDGDKLVDGMVLCIENQITIGSADLKLDDDGWTLRTKDGSTGAMFEHMVIVRENKPEILTLLD